MIYPLNHNFLLGRARVDVAFVSMPACSVAAAFDVDCKSCNTELIHQPITIDIIQLVHMYTYISIYLSISLSIYIVVLLSL